MALTKVTYENHKTVITAQNMNDIQDAILELEKAAGNVPGAGEATRTIAVINPKSNYTASEAAALPDGLYWVENPITFTNADETESFSISGLAAKGGNAWLVYDTGRACVTDAAGVLTAWTYTALPDIGDEDEGKLLTITEGRARWAGIDEIIPNGDEVAY